MKKINLAITGCMGRMGQQLIKSANKDKVFKITSLTESRRINKRIFGVFERKKKILVITNNHCSSFIWGFDLTNSRFSSSSIYLYNFLK